MLKLRQVIVAVVVAALTGAAGAGVCVAQTEAGEQKLPSVQGKVVNDTGGIGIRKVIVEFKGMNEEPAQNYETATDATGVFKIEGVALGEYTVTVRREGYFSVNPKEQETTLTVEE